MYYVFHSRNSSQSSFPRRNKKKKMKIPPNQTLLSAMTDISTCHNLIGDFVRPCSVYVYYLQPIELVPTLVYIPSRCRADFGKKKIRKEKKKEKKTTPSRSSTSKTAQYSQACWRRSITATQLPAVAYYGRAGLA